MGHVWPPHFTMLVQKKIQGSVRTCARNQLETNEARFWVAAGPWWQGLGLGPSRVSRAGGCVSRSPAQPPPHYANSVRLHPAAEPAWQSAGGRHLGHRADLLLLFLLRPVLAKPPCPRCSSPTTLLTAPCSAVSFTCLTTPSRGP